MRCWESGSATRTTTAGRSMASGRSLATGPDTASGHSMKIPSLFAAPIYKQLFEFGQRVPRQHQVEIGLPLKLRAGSPLKLTAVKASASQSEGPLVQQFAAEAPVGETEEAKQNRWALRAPGVTAKAGPPHRRRESTCLPSQTTPTCKAEGDSSVNGADILPAPVQPQPSCTPSMADLVRKQAAEAAAAAEAADAAEHQKAAAAARAVLEAAAEAVRAEAVSQEAAMASVAVSLSQRAARLDPEWEAEGATGFDRSRSPRNSPKAAPPLRAGTDQPSGQSAPLGASSSAEAYQPTGAPTRASSSAGAQNGLLGLRLAAPAGPKATLAGVKRHLDAPGPTPAAAAAQGAPAGAPLESACWSHWERLLEPRERLPRIEGTHAARHYPQQPGASARSWRAPVPPTPQPAPNWWSPDWSGSPGPRNFLPCQAPPHQWPPPQQWPLLLSSDSYWHAPPHQWPLSTRRRTQDRCAFLHVCVRVHVCNRVYVQRVCAHIDVSMHRAYACLYACVYVRKCVHVGACRCRRVGVPCAG